MALGRMMVRILREVGMPCNAPPDLGHSQELEYHSRRNLTAFMLLYLRTTRTSGSSALNRGPPMIACDWCFAGRLPG